MNPSGIILLIVTLIAGSLASAGEDPAKDPAATPRARYEKRTQQAYDRILASQTRPLATTADEVIDRCIEAMGGRQALASLRTMTVIVDGNEIAGKFGGTSHLKAPNFVWRERNGGRAIVTDGVSAWLVEGDRWQPAPPGGFQWQQLYSITLDLVDYAEKDVSYEFLGTVPLEGTALYKLRKTISTGKEFFVYFDIDAGLLVMEEEGENESWKANIFMDHREVAGVMMPHMRVRVADIIKTAHVALMSYEPNEPLPDSLFVRP